MASKNQKSQGGPIVSDFIHPSQNFLCEALAVIRLAQIALRGGKHALVAGDVSSSVLYERITTANAALRMPPAYAGHAKLSDPEIADAMRILHEDTHNMSEGAGAAALAAALKEKGHGKAAVILSGANVDRDIAAKVLAGRTP